MYAYFQPRISVEQEEADIKEMIDEEYERKEQENRDYYKQMEDWNVEREEKIKVLSEKIYNALIEGGDFSYDDIACTIAYLVGVVDGLSHRKHNTSNGSFAKYVHYLIGEVQNVLDGKSKQIQLTEHPQIMIVQEEKKPCTSNEYVDLGLPSGLKWAKCNVGAESETDFGDYYMWGSTTPNTADECTWAKAPFNNGDSYYNADAFKLVKDTVCPNGILAKEYDAAAQIMGGNWRMPTKDELKELIDNTTNEWTQVNGVNGRKFTASNGNSIFIPAAGYCYGGSVDDVGNYGYVWSSSLNTSYLNGAWYLYFRSGSCYMGNLSRYYGWSVRGVME